MYLLDTNVLSELRKQAAGRCDPNVEAWSRTTPQSLLYLSVVTLHEVEFGIRRIEQADPVKGAILQYWLDDVVLSNFRDRILAVDPRSAIRSAELHAVRARTWQDALIAAIAHVHKLVLVTRNVAGFADSKVALLNPWEA